MAINTYIHLPYGIFNSICIVFAKEQSRKLPHIRKALPLGLKTQFHTNGKGDAVEEMQMREAAEKMQMRK